MPSKLLFAFRQNSLDSVLKNPDQQPVDFLFGLRGLQQLQPKGATLDFFNARQGVRDTWTRRFFWPFETVFARTMKLGFPFEICLEHKTKLQAADAIFCSYETISFPLLLWKKMGWIQADIVVMVQSLAERLKYFEAIPGTVATITGLLKEGKHFFTLSDAARLKLIDRFALSPEKVSVLPFGVDLKFWTNPAVSKRDDSILTIGNDFNRDYETLIHAIDGRFPITAVTQKKLPPSLGLTQRHSLSHSEVRDLYQTARLVIIPSKKVETESSGLSCALQAMACGAPVLMSDSPAMREYFEEDREVFYYPPEDPQALRRKLDEVWAKPEKLAQVAAAGRKLVETRFNSDQVARQLAQYFGIQKGLN